MSDQVTDAPESTTAAPCAHRGAAVAGVTRRGLVAGGAGVGAACLLAACGSSGGASGSGSAAPESSDGSSGGSAEAPSGVPAADVAVGGGVIVSDSDAPYVVTQPSEGTYMAFTAVCTHTGCTVGEVAEGEIICNCHGSRFDAATGEVIQGPASAPLAEMSVTDEGGTLVVGA